MVLRQLTWPVGMGMACGTVVGLLGVGVLARAPFHLAVLDVAAPGAGLSAFAVTALIAALIPALRALGSDALEALRHE